MLQKGNTKYRSRITLNEHRENTTKKSKQEGCDVTHPLTE
jgi:hypothetical protein